jgi:autotransporter-associated beta strand protein
MCWRCTRVVLLAAAMGACTRVALAGIAFNSASSTLSLTHDADVSNSNIAPFVRNISPIPRSSALFPANPYQLDHTFTSGASSTDAVGSLGHVTNSTTASFTLATGTGVTQTDPGNAAYPGDSSLKFNIDAWWDVTTGGFGPLANGFGSLTAGGTVGVGGDASLSINIIFENASGTDLRTPWVVNKTWGAGPFNQTFSTGLVLNSPAASLPAGSRLRVRGTVEFRANNAETPTNFDAVRVEMGGAPPTAMFATNSEGDWFDRTRWQTVNVDEPGLLSLANGTGQRATFFGTSDAQLHRVDLGTAVTLGTLDIDAPRGYSFSGAGSLTFATQAGNAVINVRNIEGANAIGAPVSLRNSTEVIVEGKSTLTMGELAIADGRSLIKDGTGTLILNGAQKHGLRTGMLVSQGHVNLNTSAGPTVSLNIAGNEDSLPAIVALGSDQDLAELTVDFKNGGRQMLDLASPTGTGAFHAVNIYAGDLPAVQRSLWDAIINANAPGATDKFDGITDTGLHANSRIGITTLENHILLRPTRIGDLNLDGRVTIGDFITLASHFNQTDAMWDQGDLNYDRAVTIADFIELAANFNQSYSGESFPISDADASLLQAFAAQNVPEPAIASAALGLLLLTRRQKRPGNLLENVE